MYAKQLLPIELGLAKRGIIDINSDTERDVACYVRESLKMLAADGSPEIVVNISSRGGDFGYGLDIYDMLRLYTGKKTGRVIAGAFSMGAIILQACDVRECTRHAQVLIHHVKRPISLDVLRNKVKLHKVVKEMEEQQKSLYDILAQRTGKSVAIVRRTCAKDKKMSPSEALAFGLIDKII